MGERGRKGPGKYRVDRRELARWARENARDLRLVLALVCTFCLYGIMNRDWGQAVEMSLDLDEAVPLLPWTIVIYHLWMPTLIAIGLFLLFRRRALFRVFACSVFVGALLAYTTFVLLTTRVPRPLLAGAGLFEGLLASTYAIDAPFAGFPSVHVLMIVIFTYCFCRAARRRTSRLALGLWSCLIVLSTVTTKQHVVLDIAGGLLYALPALGLGTFLAKRLRHWGPGTSLGPADG